MSETAYQPGRPRSAGAIPQRRVPQIWPKDRRFRILSLDGGGIRGIYTATVLAELERRYCRGRSIGAYFDLIAGTSTGGIIALGIGAGLPATSLEHLYVERGGEIFPPPRSDIFSGLRARLAKAKHLVLYKYDRRALEDLLDEIIGKQFFGDSRNRLCIPAFDGTHSEVFVYKTPHHPDYKFDRHEEMSKVALATSAAPTFFRPYANGNYQLVDGGIWANNPIMLAVIEALTCFDISTDQIDVLSVGCGEDPYILTPGQISFGGLLHWRTALFAAMRLQSLAATNRARLLLGPPHVTRILPKPHVPPVELDDYLRAKSILPEEGLSDADRSGEAIRSTFLAAPALPYVPCPV